MRIFALLSIMSIATMAMADREITVPKGKKIRDGFVRAELLGVPGAKDTRFWLGAGFLQAFDAEFTSTRTSSQDWVDSFDLSYNFAPPFIDVSPGISIGVQDALNVTEEGRAVYFATTYRYGNEGALNQDVPTELTLGFWSRKSGLFFFGLSLPFSDKLFFLGEHDSNRLAGGIELRPFAGLTLKTVFESGATSFGMSLSRRF